MKKRKMEWSKVTGKGVDNMSVKANDIQQKVSVKIKSID